MPAKHNDIVKEELQEMLRARIMEATSSPWGFSVVIARKSDDRPRFCIDCRALNRRMKADRFRLPRIDEILDGMSGDKVFTKLEMFAADWKIQLANHVQEEKAFTL